jgi:hypothetical protein
MVFISRASHPNSSLSFSAFMLQHIDHLVQMKPKDTKLRKPRIEQENKVTKYVKMMEVHGSKLSECQCLWRADNWGSLARTMDKRNYMHRGYSDSLPSASSTWALIEYK